MNPEQYRRLIAIALVGSLLIAFFAIRPGHPDLWLQLVLDWLHVPLFGLITIALFVVTPQRWTWWQRALSSFAAAILFGMVTEAIQIPMANRDASAHDVGNDLLGATAFLCLIAAFGRSPSLRPWHRFCLVTVSVALLAWSAKPLVSVSLAYLERSRQAPSIAPLRTRASRLFFDLKNATVRYIEAPAEGRIKPEFRLDTGGDASVDFHDPLPDWRSYDALILDISNTSKAQLDLALRIHDRQHLRGEQPGSDRFRRALSLSPGRHQLRIELDEISRAPSDREMDLGRIDGLVLYQSGPGAGRQFVIHDIRLD